MLRHKRIQLIVNADDYAYYPGVSRGIVAAAAAGKVTATGIIANSPCLSEHLAWLDKVYELDVGVHLNLTSGRPLTAGLAAYFTATQGEFPNAYHISAAVLSRKISIEQIRQEWSAQIEACGGRKLVFLNSHEHIHMLPVLFKLSLELAKEYQIPYLRLSQADWSWPLSGAGLIRNGLLQVMASINQQQLKRPMPIFLGLAASGKLNLDYLRRVFSRLKAGVTYELMCHPGYLVAGDITNPHLLAYHAWEQELALLQSPKLEELYEQFGISLGRYP